MGQYLGKHEVMVIGGCKNITAGDASAATVIDSSPGDGPHLYLVHAVDGDVYCKQGKSGAAVTSSSFELKEGAYMKILVTGTENNYLATMRKGDTDVTVKVTQLDALTPGDDS